jgi:WD40 repeat protein
MEASTSPTKSNGPFPTELLVNIFIYLDGPTLSSCSQVCTLWHSVISEFDSEIWPFACRRDFESSPFTSRSRSSSRFWSLQFPMVSPKGNRSWQDMYRITRNWYTGLVQGFYPSVLEDQLESRKSACAVIGVPQEQGMFTSLTLANDGRVIRSNPNYHGPTGSSSLVIQSPQTKQRFFLNTSSAPNDHQPQQIVEAVTTRTHSIVCHHTHPNSKWLVTGGLNGTVAVWDLTTKSLVKMWPGHRGRVLCISMNDEG